MEVIAIEESSANCLIPNLAVMVDLFIWRDFRPGPAVDLLDINAEGRELFSARAIARTSVSPLYHMGGLRNHAKRSVSVGMEGRPDRHAPLSDFGRVTQRTCWIIASGLPGSWRPAARPSRYSDLPTPPELVDRPITGQINSRKLFLKYLEEVTLKTNLSNLLILLLGRQIRT